MREIVNFGRARATDFSHTANGLLTKRAELFNEAEIIRERLAEIRNDIGALDRVLSSLGYTGDLDAKMPRAKRHVIFGKGELSRQVVSVLMRTNHPMTSRQIAQDIVNDSGLDARDRKFVGDLTKRVGKALRQYKTTAIIKAADAQGNIVWSLGNKTALSNGSDPSQGLTPALPPASETL